MPPCPADNSPILTKNPINPISLIRDFFPSRSQQAQNLTTFVDDICKKDTISRGTLKRLERMFNATERHIHQEPNFESNRSAVLADIQDTHDRVAPHMPDSQSKVVMAAATGIMLERIRNWHLFFDDNAVSQSNVYYPMHLSLKQLARPWEVALKESAPLNQSTPRWINERTMSLYEGFASKVNKKSVSDTTLNKLDAIFMRETKILLKVCDDDQQPTLMARNFGNPRQGGFRDLAHMSTQLDRIDALLGPMEDSHAARSLRWKAKVYKDHIEVAQQWWQTRASAISGPADTTSPDFAYLKYSVDMAKQARVWLGAPSDENHR